MDVAGEQVNACAFAATLSASGLGATVATGGALL